MIKQLLSEEIKDYLNTDSNKILLDVRTEEEWNLFGKPNGNELGLKTYFLTIKDENFIQEFNKLQISKDEKAHKQAKKGRAWTTTSGSEVKASLTEKNKKSITLNRSKDNFTIVEKFLYISARVHMFSHWFTMNI